MITTLTEPCWHRLPTNIQEETDLADYDPHYDSEAALRADVGDGPDKPIKAEVLPAPCKTLSCDGCGGEALNDDTGGIIHFPPEPYGPEPSVDLVEFEAFGDRVLCFSCQDKAERDELRKVGG